MNPLSRLVDWLRAGYPQGVPETDYVALFGILHRNLTMHEIEQVARALKEGPAGSDGVIDEEEISEMIRNVAHQEASAQDIHRVAGHLAAGGWPLQGLPQALDDEGESVGEEP